MSCARSCSSLLLASSTLSILFPSAAFRAFASTSSLCSSALSPFVSSRSLARRRSSPASATARSLSSLTWWTCAWSLRTCALASSWLRRRLCCPSLLEWRRASWRRPISFSASTRSRCFWAAFSEVSWSILTTSCSRCSAVVRSRCRFSTRVSWLLSFWDTKVLFFAPSNSSFCMRLRSMTFSCLSCVSSSESVSICWVLVSAACCHLAISCPNESICDSCPLLRLCWFSSSLASMLRRLLTSPSRSWASLSFSSKVRRSCFSRLAADDPSSDTADARCFRSSCSTSCSSWNAADLALRACAWLRRRSSRSRTRALSP
mmetsp:Transcript_30061/g.72369  ORF Transcript_30061/g.72369 Transcript_30061/m.72369 type:complete len:318 (-) Transcript_30061:317-1270(-)